MLRNEEPRVRRCVACGTTKQLTGFYRAEGFASGHLDECKVCHGERMTRASHTAKVDRELARREVQAAKNRPCMDCGGKFVASAMDHDHVPGRGEKMFNLSNIPYSADLTMVRREMAKCDVVCANCHRKRTSERKGTKQPRSLLDQVAYQLKKHPMLHDMIAAERGRRNRGETLAPEPVRNPVNGRYMRRW